MPFFHYEAVDSGGKQISGTMNATAESDVTTNLTERGFTQVTIFPPRGAANGTASSPSNRSMSMKAQPQAAPVAAPRSPDEPRKMTAKPKDSALFYRQLAALVRSGISIFQALDNLGPRTTQPAYRFAAREMADATRNGGPMSEVMARHPSLFPDHVVAAVKAGETGGFIEVVLDEIGYEYEQHTAFYKGMAIPTILVIQQLFAIAVAQPLFPTLFPLFQVANYLIAVGRNTVIVCALIYLARLYTRWLCRPENEQRRHRMLLKAPIFGDLARQRALAAFVRMMRRLYGAGIGPIGTWEGAMHVPGNAIIRDKLVDAYGLVRSGVPIHEAFSTTGLFANEMEQLLATGFVTGEVVETLDRVAEYYQDNVDRAFRNARFTMWRIAICTMIILIGATLILMTKTYFEGIFKTVEDWFPEMKG